MTYFILLLTISLSLSVGQVFSQEYSLEGDQREEFHKELNSYTHFNLGTVPLQKENQISMVVGVGQWIDGTNYGYGLNIHFMPTTLTLGGEGSRSKLDYNALSVFGRYIFVPTSWLELNLYHSIGSGLIKVISQDESKSGSSQYYEGFAFGDLGLGVDFPINDAFELSAQVDWRQGLYLDDAALITTKDLSGPSLHLGFRWYPSSISEVK